MKAKSPSPFRLPPPVIPYPTGTQRKVEDFEEMGTHEHEMMGTEEREFRKPEESSRS